MPSTRNQTKSERQPKHKTKRKTNSRQRQGSRASTSHQPSSTATERGNIEQAVAQPEPNYQPVGGGEPPQHSALNPSAVPDQPVHNSSQHGNIPDPMSNLQPAFDGFIAARNANFSGLARCQPLKNQEGLTSATSTCLDQTSIRVDSNSGNNNQASVALGVGPVSTSTPTVPVNAQPPFQLGSPRPDVIQAVDQGQSFAPLSSVCDPLGCDLAIATKEKIWKGDFVSLESLNTQNQLASQSQSPTSWTFSSLGQNLVAQPVAQPKREIKGIFQWTNAFLIYMSIFLERHPARANELLKYVATIREFSQTMGNTAWLMYDLEFRKKQARRPTNPWSSIDMELYAKMLMFGNSNDNQRFSTGSVFQYSRRQATTFRTQKRPCFAFNKGACKMPASRCTYAHKCLKCDEIGHPSMRCLQGSGQSLQPY